jgi:anaerobic magnesium-protoporphyrin IX monomethyl ester cyclase
MNKVIIIATNQPLDNDAQIRGRIESSVKRAERQSSRFPGLDLPAIQRGVNENLTASHLFLNGRFMDLLDLLNFVRNHRRTPTLTPQNVGEYYSLANSVTLNGIYLYQYLQTAGYDPLLVQNYAVCSLPELLDEDPMASCISSNFVFMDDIKEMASRIKEHTPDLPVIVGGMLVKKILDPGEGLSREAKQYLSTFHGKVDAFIVEPQGEQTLLHLLKTIENRGDFATVPNLAFFDEKGALVFTDRIRENLHMDDTAIAWDKIPVHYLRKTLPVNSSRGCFYRCRFCTYHWFFPEVHYKTLDVLMEELRGIQALGFVKHVRFTDDNFTANKSRIEALLQRMIKEKFDFTWSSFVRASALSPALVRLMKASGAEFVDIGLESGSQTILNNMDKKLKSEQSFEAIRMLNDHGIYSRGSFIIGFPGETKETFSETVDFINESGLPYYHPYLFYLSQHSPIYRERDRFGLEGIGGTWRHHSMDAVEASDLMSRMITEIPRSFTDGHTYVEEIYKLLRGEGFLPDAILNFFRLKRELLLSKSSAELHSSADQIFLQLEALIGSVP